jgi:hypothetical protein
VTGRQLLCRVPGGTRPLGRFDKLGVVFRLLRRIAGIRAFVPVAVGCLLIVGGLSASALARPSPGSTEPVGHVASLSVAAATEALVPLAASLTPGQSQPAPQQPGPGATGTRSASAAESTLELGPNDNGSIRTVSTGTAIVVRLPGVARFRWTVPNSSNSGVVRLVAGSGGTDGSSQATFAAVATGEAVLTAIDNPFCFPVCALPPAGGWRVTIVVK